MKKFKAGDKVLVTAGKDKGKKGKITKVLPKKDRVIVKDINLFKKHVKSTQDKPGGIIEKERSLPTANIMILEAADKPTRVGFKVTKSGKTRISRKTGKAI